MAARKPSRGRPTTYNADTAALICARLAGGEPITRICRDPDMPALQTHYRWIAAHPEYSEQYMRAREDQADTLAAEIIDIADQSAPEGVQTARLRVDARKWYAGKLRPKVYGDKVQTELTGKDGGPVEISRIERVIVDPQ